MEQGSSEWLIARAGSLGASQINDALSGKDTAARRNLRVRLAIERITGAPMETFCSDVMRRGQELEPQARDAYSFVSGYDVEQVGIFFHPDIKFTHASPDGLIDNDGMVEIKCPTSANHIDWMMKGVVPTEHTNQMYWQMEVTGREWNQFVSYDDRLPVKLQLFTVRLNRDEERIKVIRSGVVQFLDEVAEMVGKLRERM